MLDATFMHELLKIILINFSKFFVINIYISPRYKYNEMVRPFNPVRKMANNSVYKRSFIAVDQITVTIKGSRITISFQQKLRANFENLDSYKTWRIRRIAQRRSPM